MKNYFIIFSLVLLFFNSISGMVSSEQRSIGTSGNRTSDLFVSPDGSDENTGFDPEYPLRTIAHALLIVQPDPVDPPVIHLSNGIYSQETNGESFPLVAVSNTVIEGESTEGVIIKGDNVSRVWVIEDVEDFTLSGLTLTSVNTPNIAEVVRCSNSDVQVIRVLMTQFDGGGNYVWRQTDSAGNSSSVIFDHVTITNNNSPSVVVHGRTNFIIKNSIFWNNNLINFNVYIYGQPDYGITIFNSIIEGGIYSMVLSNPDVLTWGPEIITDSPLFCDPVNMDYTVSENSPAVGLGDDGSVAGALTIGCGPQEPWLGPVFHVTMEGSDITGNGSVASPFQSVQRAINTTLSGDTVLVHPGHYFGHIDFHGRDIVVTSEYILTNQDSTIRQTVIDANSTVGSVVEFRNGETNAAQLIGFTLTGGSGHPFDGFWGGGIYCDDASPTLKHLIIRDNHVHGIGFTGGIGGGIYINDSSPILENIEITHNSAFFGGGMYIDTGSMVTLDRVTISDNFVIDSLYWTGYIGGISISYNVGLTMRNTILWGNGEENHNFNGVPDIRYSNIQGGYEGTGNIDTDPLFTDPENGDYSLLQDSPCIDAGDPDSPLDPDGTVADMGAYYYNQTPDCCEPVGDLNCNGNVNILDIVFLVGCILETVDDPACECGDLNGDNSVDIMDIMHMLDLWPLPSRLNN